MSEIMAELSATDPGGSHVGQSKAQNGNVGSDTKVQPIDALTAEIARLQVSRKRYEAQTAALLAQQNLLNGITPSLPSTQMTLHSFTQESLRGSQYTSALNEETATSLKARLNAQKLSLSAMTVSAPAKLTRLLKTHDQSLSALKIPIEADPHSKHREAESNRLTILTEALAKLRADAVRDRLDSVYIRSLAEAKVVDDQVPSSTVKEVEALEEDIKSLYVEIEDVSVMLAKHQYRKPLEQASADAQAEARQARSVLLGSAVQCFASMTDELRDMETMLHGVRSGNILVRDFQTKISDIESSMDKVLKGPAGTSNLDTPQQDVEAEKARKKLLDHLNGSAEAGSAGKDGFEMQAIVEMLTSAAQTRRAAVSTLEAAANAPNTAADQVIELERRIAHARRLLEQRQPT